MTNLEERQAFAKLEALKDIRAKTIGLEKTRASLLCDVGQLEDEERCLQEYRRELELLQQEKMAHVEELRQIHADINAMEAIIKQAEESKRIAQDSARKLLSEYVPLVQDVNRMRVELLELDKLPDIPDSEKDRLKAAGILDKDKSLSDPWPKPLSNHTVADDSTVKYDWPNWFSVKSVGNEMLIPNSLSLPTPPTHNPFFSMTRQPSPLFGSLGLSKTGFCPPSSINPMPNPAPFRYQQQPPPMKSCLSCHQQIHRNAPICPLCKAKSRSRNPKKPKKKE